MLVDCFNILLFAKKNRQRKQNKKKAEDLMKAGRENEARDFLRRSVDINHLMALELMKAARKMQVCCYMSARFYITTDYQLWLYRWIALLLPTRQTLSWPS